MCVCLRARTRDELMEAKYTSKNRQTTVFPCSNNATIKKRPAWLCNGDVSAADRSGPDIVSYSDCVGRVLHVNKCVSIVRIVIRTDGPRTF